MKFALHSLLILIIAVNESRSVNEERCKRQAGGTCFLMPEATEGPYYWNSTYNRPNVTEDRQGVPFTLRITVIEVGTCQAIPMAAIDIWHCDATGIYSHFVNASLSATGGGGSPPGMNGTQPSGPPSGMNGTQPAGGGSTNTDNSTFLRGLQVTGNNGQATFYTIYPGWYSGRATHIHVKVHISGTFVDTYGVYTGGHVSHTGQLFFNDTLTNQVALIAPYASHNITRLLNSEDGIFTGQGGSSSLLSVTFMNESLGFSGGVMASITLGINSSSTPAPVQNVGDGSSSSSNLPTSTLSSNSDLSTLINSALIALNFVVLFLY